MTEVLIRGARKVDARGEVDDFWMSISGGVITATGSGPAPGAPGAKSGGAQPAWDVVVDAVGRYLVPGFVDLHGHGGGGRSFDDGPDDIRTALATHRAHGTTRSVLSLVANPISALQNSLATIADLMCDDPLILGSHLEGPFLAADNRGAHRLEHLASPDSATIARLVRSAAGTLRQVTIAPELPGAFGAIEAFLDVGAAVAVGHTNADAQQAHAAFERGATILTHAFNAMPGIHHRAPGPVMAAIEDDRVTLELILDGIHIHESVARLAFATAPGRIALVTDAMAAAGFGDGDFTLGSLTVAVRGGRAMLRGANTIAGSTLTQDVALRRAICAAGIAPVDAVTALTQTPARALGLDHRFGLLEPGFAADAVLLDDRWQVSEVWADGSIIPLE